MLPPPCFILVVSLFLREFKFFAFVSFLSLYIVRFLPRFRFLLSFPCIFVSLSILSFLFIFFFLNSPRTSFHVFAPFIWNSWHFSASSFLSPFSPLLSFSFISRSRIFGFNISSLAILYSRRIVLYP